MKSEDKAVIDAAIVLAYESEARTLVDNQPVLVPAEHLRALVQAVIKRRDARTWEETYRGPSPLDLAGPTDPSLQLPAGAMAVEIEAADGGRTTSGRYYAVPRNTPESQ